MKRLCIDLCSLWPMFAQHGHPLELGHDFQSDVLAALQPTTSDGECIPHLGKLVCCSAFDLALHDAYGNLHDVDIYSTYTHDWMSRDLDCFFRESHFAGQFPAQYLRPREDSLLAWHMIGAVDALSPDAPAPDPPDDGYPTNLLDWIHRDGLAAIKIKLMGNDRDWDLNRLIQIGQIAIDHAVPHLSADFNCTAIHVDYVEEVLAALARDHPQISDRLLYVEQPFSRDLENNQLDVRSIASRKPLFLDESAHDWQMVRLGHSLGWNGVALKTCKTQTNAILSLCWARAHGMQIMVQDLTNPMLATIPHALLAAHSGTIAGVEVNACQFYPDASHLEARIHPNLYRRNGGRINLTTVKGPGFGQRVTEINRPLPVPAVMA